MQSLLIVPMDFRAGNAHDHLKGYYMNIEGTPSPVLEFKKTAPPPSGLARLNGKEWKVVVAARQYPSSSFLARGFGDVTSGIRLLQHVQKDLPTAKCFFVFEHFAEDKHELSKLKNITKHPDVETYILCGRKDNPFFDVTPEQMNWEHQTAEVINLLDSADLIIHAPSGLITPVKNFQERYSSKLLGFSEYEERFNFDHEQSTAIKTLNMGFHINRLYLADIKSDATDFNDPLLANHCLNPNSDSSMAGKRRPFYFAYGHTSEEFFALMLRLITLAEGGDDREIVLVTTLDFHSKLIDKCCDKLDQHWCPYGVIRLCWLGTDDRFPQKHDIVSGSDERAEKRVTVITPKHLNNSDFLLLQKGSILNYSSGDISTSDVIALGKIPILDPSKKVSLYRKFCEKLEKFCEIPGNEEYIPLFDTWLDAIANFYDPDRYECQLHPDPHLEALRQLNSPQWQRFEQVFTDWLKQNNETDTVISREIAAILESAEPSTKRVNFSYREEL